MAGVLPHAITAMEAMRPVAVVEAARCTRPHGSDCRTCAEACPRQAIVVDGDPRSPTVDADPCIGCGVCAPACPTAAVGGVGTPPERIIEAAVDNPGGFAVRCGALAGKEVPDGPVADRRLGVWCLAGMHPETVAAAAARLDPGAVLELRHADCSACPVAAATRMAELTEQAVRLSARVAPQRRVEMCRVELEESPPEPSAGGSEERRPAATTRPARRWGRRRQARPQPPEPVVTPGKVSRRRLLLGLADPPAGEPGDADRPTASRPGAVTPARGVLLAAVPAPPLPRPFAAEGCTGCRACSRTCPTDALGWITRLPHQTLYVDPESCIGCAECVRVCPAGVLDLGETPGDPGPAATPVEPQVVATVALQACRRCGAVLAASESDTCTRCSSRRSIADDVWARLGN